MFYVELFDGGGTTAAVLTVDTAIDESREETATRVAFVLCFISAYIFCCFFVLTFWSWLCCSVLLVLAVPRYAGMSRVLLTNLRFHFVSMFIVSQSGTTE